MDQNERLIFLTHQLRSAVGGIRFVTDMIQHGDYGLVPDGLKQPITLIQQAAAQGLALIEVVSDDARFDLDGCRLDIENIDLVHELQALCDFAHMKAVAKGVAFQVRTESLPSLIPFDRHVLRVVVSNLLDNAIAYTDAGSIELDVSYTKGRLQLCVQDTGRGLSIEDKAHLFKRFYRGHASADERFGSGFGLYLVKRMVEAMKGTLEVQSEGVNRGSVFTVTIPVAI